MVRAKRKGDGSKAQSCIVTVRLDPEVDAALRALADRAGITRSQVIRDAILTAAAGPDRLDVALAALARIEARLAGTDVAPGASEGDRVGPEATVPVRAAPADTAWLPEEER